MPFISLHGRAFGFDSDTGAIVRNGLEGGSGDESVSAASTAANLAPRGMSTLAATAIAAYTLTAPITGVKKEFFVTATTTFAQTVRLASGTFRTTGGSTFSLATFNTAGQALTLTALSTALFGVMGNLGTVTFST